MIEHNYELNEKYVRREIKYYLLQLRKEHEILVSGLLRSSRISSIALCNESSYHQRKSEFSIADFRPTVANDSELSTGSILSFTIESYGRTTHTAAKTHSQSTSISLPYITPLPLYKDYTSLSVGVHVEDDECLRYLPYFGENGEEADLDLEEMFEDRTGTRSELLRREKAQIFAASFFKFVENYGIFKHHLVSFFIYHVPNNSIARKMTMPDRYRIDEKKKKQLEETCRKLDNRHVAKVELICRLFKEITKVSVWEVLNIFPVNSLTEDKRASLRSSQTTATFSLDSYSSLLCQFCYMHECPWHDSSFLTVTPDGSLKPPSLHDCNNSNRSEAKRRILPDSVPCSGSCKIQASPPKSLRAWSDEDISIMKMTYNVMGANNRISCILATIIDRPCNEIHAKLYDLSLISPLNSSNGKPSTTTDTLEYYASHVLNKRKRRAQSVYPEDCSLSGNHLKRGNVQPCMHSGQCEETNCACVVNKVFCEKACACPQSCPRRWRGCRCTTSRCRTSACECYKWNRECDPDLCRSCGADEILDPKNRDIVEIKRFCKNVNLQRGLGKRVIVGPSAVSGWGLFLGEPMNQDDFLGEYKGELISQDEAERRGKIYDKRGVSFLFESSKDQCVDATRAGDKLRFINHSRQNPNCHARILLVNGIHRIAFFARRKIKEGEELFIDYGYNNKTMKFVPLEINNVKHRSKNRIQ
ncbi:hypothetical protein V1511DRAFT_506318 [Dipodascopsis uninucleata]